jgi:hypothetical protein
MLTVSAPLLSNRCRSAWRDATPLASASVDVIGLPNAVVAFGMSTGPALARECEDSRVKDCCGCRGPRLGLLDCGCRLVGEAAYDRGNRQDQPDAKRHRSKRDEIWDKR